MTQQRYPDPDLRSQAKLGYGVPSQDPSPEAQLMLSDAEQQREFTSSFTGSGLIGGAALLATFGGLMAGSTGLLLGAMVGAFTGVWAGISIAEHLLKERTDLLQI